MRKRLITKASQDARHLDEGWLDLDSAAIVEVASEEKDYPVEFALISGEMRGWRASAQFRNSHLETGREKVSC